MVTTTRRRVAGARVNDTRKPCAECGRTLYLCTTALCSRCYRKAHPLQVGECLGCHETKPLRCRGLCAHCHKVCPDEGQSCYRTRQDTPEELAAAKAREGEFLTVIRPAVLQVANKRLRIFSNPETRRELKADAVALAWLYFIRLIADGHEPTRCMGVLIKRVFQTVFRFSGVTGACSTTDLLSPRVRYHRLAATVEYEDHKLHNRADERKELAEDVVAEMAWREFLASLGGFERELLEFLRHNPRREALREFGLTARQLEWRLKKIRAAWDEYHTTTAD
jgi:hypothetical protein